MWLFGRNQVGTGQALTMLDGLVNLKGLSKKERNSLYLSCLSNLKDKLEKIRVLNKKARYLDYLKYRSESNTFLKIRLIADTSN